MKINGSSVLRIGTEMWSIFPSLVVITLKNHTSPDKTLHLDKDEAVELAEALKQAVANFPVPSKP